MTENAAPSPAVMLRFRLPGWAFACATLVLALSAGVSNAQVPGPNINMVSGTTLPDGDPFLQRQNEPSIAVSTRNPCHLLAGANDYRTVDIPGLPDDKENGGDAWLGLFKSFDCGRTWKSTLMPGYLQDPTSQGQKSRLFGLAAGADPIVRAGTNGLFYYSGIVFDRGANAPSKVFVARFVDNNVEFNANGERVDPIAYLDTSVVDAGTSGQFNDKPFIAVDIPRNAKTCSIAGQTIPAGTVYIVFSTFVGNLTNNTTKLMVSQSTDCGATWTKPTKISEGAHTNQGAMIAVAPNGHVYVAWRQFVHGNQPDAILVSRSTDSAKTFSKATTVATIAPFDQNTTGASFRTNAYPTIAIDGEKPNRVYVAWSARGFAKGRPDPVTGDARIVMSTSTDGVKWSPPVAVDNPPAGTEESKGHQIMPALMFAGGKLQLIYYDLREDQTYLSYYEKAEGYIAAGVRRAIGDRVKHPEYVFWQWLADVLPPTVNDTLTRRHNVDVRGMQIGPGAVAPFEPSWRISQYKFGVTLDEDATAATIRQVEFNAPNLPLYAKGTKAFFGDYIDVAGVAFVPTANGGWAFNTDPQGPQVFHAVWTDNRDVRPPRGDLTWADYTPPTLPADALEGWPGNPSRPVCDPTKPSTAGMRNSNVYTSRISPPLVMSSPGNARGLDQEVPAAFPVVVTNNTKDLKTYVLHIVPPANAIASFAEATLKPDATGHFAPPVDWLTVDLRPMSSIARTVFVIANGTSDEAKRASVTVEIKEQQSETAPTLASLVLNADPTSPTIRTPDIMSQSFDPDIMNPVIGNADLMNAALDPDIMNTSTMNPVIGDPDIMTVAFDPDIMNPDLTSASYDPDIMNPNLTSVSFDPDIMNPAFVSVAISDPDIMNPAIMEMDLKKAILTDVTWKVTNKGTAAGSYSARLFLKQPPSGFVTQLMVHKAQLTPAAGATCELAVRNQSSVLVNIPDPLNQIKQQSSKAMKALSSTASAAGEPDYGDATFALAPGEQAWITLRIANPDKTDSQPVVIGGRTVWIDPAFDPRTTVTTVVTAQAVNSQDFVNNNMTPPAAASVPPLEIATTSFPDEVLFDAAGGGVAASGGWGTYSWTVISGSLPPGMSLNASSGGFAGTPTALGTYTFTVQVADCANNSCSPGVAPQTASHMLSLRVSAADQNFWLPTTGGPSMSFGGGTRVAQVFFAGTDASLTGFRFTTPLTCPAGTVVTGEVRAITGGAPPAVVDSGPPLATASATMPASPFQLPPLSLDSAVPFVLNAPFAVVLSATNSCTMNGCALDAYAGRALIDTGSGWGALPSVPDLPLQTLIMPQNVGFLSANRLDHVSGELPDNRVLIAGGWRPEDPFAEIHDLVTDQSTALAGSYANRAQATLTRLADGRLVIIGGRATNSVTNKPEDLASIDIFNPATNMFASGETLHDGRSQHTATLLLDGRILVAGGLRHDPVGNTDAALQSVEIYDPATGSCQLVPASMHVARFGHSAVLLADGGHVLLAGGLWAGLTAEVYDISAGSFTSTGPMVAWRSGPTATLLTVGPNAGKVLIAGGIGGDSRAVSLTELFDPAGGGTFSSHVAMRVARGNHTATVLDGGSIVFAGGTPNWEGVDSHAVASIEIYDPVAGQFRSQGTLKVNRERHTATRIGSGPSTAIVFAGGNSSSALTARTIEVYSPATNALTITTAGLPEGVVGQPYPGARLTAAGGTGTGYTFTVVTGALPTGLLLWADGVISGVPATGTQGPWTFTVRVQDSASNTAYRTLIIAIDPLQITGPPTLPSGIVGVPYLATQLQATGFGTLTWSIESGGLPPGLSLSSEGVVSGTPTSAGSFAFMARVVDAIEQVASRTFVISVSASAPLPGQALTVLVSDQSGLDPPSTFDRPSGDAMNAAGDYLFVAASSAAFLRRAGAPAPVRLLQMGDPVPGFPGSRTDLVENPRINASGQALIEVEIYLGNTMKHAVLGYDSGVFRTVAYSEDVAPGSGGATFSRYVEAFGFNDAGATALSALSSIFIAPASGPIVRLVGPGDAAPGTGGTLRSISPLAFNNAGQVLFLADIVGGSEGAGLFVASIAGGVSTIVATGTTDPNDGTFTVATQSAIGQPRLNNAGQVAFVFGTRLYLSAPSLGTLGLAVGTLTTLPWGATITSISSVGLNDPGDLAFSANLSGAGAPGRAVLRRLASDGSIGAVASTNDSAPGTPGRTFGSFSSVQLNAARLIAFSSELSGLPAATGLFNDVPGSGLAVVMLSDQASPIGGTYGSSAPVFRLYDDDDHGNGFVYFESVLQGGSADYASFIATDTATTALCSTADVLPAGSRVTLRNFWLGAASDYVAFSARRAGGGGAIFVHSVASGTTWKVVGDGDPAPGGGGRMDVGIPNQVPLGADGTVAFNAIVAGGPGTSVFTWTSSAGVRKVAGPGDTPVGAGGPLASAALASSPPLPINDVGQVVFTASWSGGSGLFVPAPGPTITKVVAIGDTAPTGGTFTAFPGFRLINGTGHVVFMATTSTGGGIYVATPGSPTTITKVVAADEEFSDPGGGTFTSFGSTTLARSKGPLGFGDTGVVVFSAVLTGGAGGGIFVGSATSAPAAVALNGASSPAGGVYSFTPTSIDARINDEGDVLFAAPLSGASDSGLFLKRAATSTVETVAVQGMPAPGTVGTFRTMNMTTNNIPGEMNALGPTGDVAFFNAVDIGGTAVTGLFRYRGAGLLEKLAMRGDPMPGYSGATVGTVSQGVGVSNTTGRFFSRVVILGASVTDTICTTTASDGSGGSGEPLATALSSSRFGVNAAWDRVTGPVARARRSRADPSILPAAARGTSCSPPRRPVFLSALR